MSFGYRTEMVRLPTGERLPLLLHCGSGMPLTHATDYTLANHRGIPFNTSRRTVDAIAQLHAWADSRHINLDERFGTGNLLDSDEVTSLAEALWTNRNPAKAGLAVVGATHGFRIDQVNAYVTWRAGLITRSMSINDDRLENFNVRLAAVKAQLVSLKGDSVSSPRGQLDEAQWLRMFEIVRPGSTENPFQKRNQLRNLFLLAAYHELGLRKAEPLVIKGSHIRFGPRPLLTITFTPNDPKDTRSDQPSVKTLSRTLPMSPMLALTAERLLRERGSIGNTRNLVKKIPFVVLTGDGSRPLSLDGVYDIFCTLRRKFPNDFPKEFGSHHLRRSWNYRFSRAIEAAKVPEEMADHVRRYVMGWSKTSTQPSNYNRRAIEEQAFKLLLRMQDGMTGMEQ